MKVEAVDETTVRMTFPVPTPGIINRFAVDYGQPFQPKHFLSRFHGKYNPGADKLDTPENPVLPRFLTAAMA